MFNDAVESQLLRHKTVLQLKVKYVLIGKIDSSEYKRC